MLVSKNTNRFDDVVVGSSPMMVMQAIRLARAGRRVCLIERSSQLGGNWQTAKLRRDEVVEIACHLIEVFPGIYDLLENYSGVPFVPLRVQPIRVFRSGLRVSYSSRWVMLASGSRLFIGLLRAYFDLWLGAAPDYNRLLNFRAKLKSYLKYQLPNFFGTFELKGPKGGFVHFINQLCDRARNEGVVFRQSDIVEIRLDNKRVWHVRGVDQDSIAVERVHVTCSTNLEHASAGVFVAGPRKEVHRVCIVVDVSRDCVVANYSYVAFWADPLIARIARIDQPGPPQDKLRFLVEFHDADINRVSDWRAAISARMVHSGIIEDTTELRIAGQVDCMFTANVDQFPAGRLDHNMWAYYSTGNLAAGLAAWRQSKITSAP